MLQPFNYRQSSKLRIFYRPISYFLKLATLMVIISGCATPQERAIKAFCENQALQAYPEKLEQRLVRRYVQVGERNKGFKNTCKTVVTTDRTTKAKTEEVTCMEEPIKEAVYDYRQFLEMVDINQVTRTNEVTVCTSNALGQGMFKDYK